MNERHEVKEEEGGDVQQLIASRQHVIETLEDVLQIGIGFFVCRGYQPLSRPGTVCRTGP
jgi:hypothetical protein